MTKHRITAWKRALSGTSSRRDVLRGLAGASFGLGGLHLAEAVEARNKKKNKRKKRKDEKQDKQKRQKQDQNQDPPVDTPPVVDPPSPPPPPPPPAPPVRQVVTQTFSNAARITIHGVSTFGPATPYPSPIVVSGLTNGVIIDINVLLNDVDHEFPDDVEVLLAATHLPGRNAIIMSDVGDFIDAINVNLVLDDAAATVLPDVGPLVSGAFQPTNIGAGDIFPAPSPPPTGNSQLSTFNGQNPNGTWQLFVVDDTVGSPGAFADGWALQITAEVDV